MFVVKVKVKA